MKTAREWRDFYARERAQLGEAGLSALLDRARPLELPKKGALVFPHTRLETSGWLVAAVAKAVVASGCDEVVALGILHGGRSADADLVRRAREGAPSARASLRRMHGPDVPGDEARWSEEFSLDGFTALVELAAKRAGKKAPRVVPRYPFLSGESPADLPGMDDTRARLDKGAALVATADPVHHGAGYGARDEDCMPLADPQTLEFTRWTIERGFEMLAERDNAGFLRHAAEVRSDFRDTGPAMAWLIDPKKKLEMEVLDSILVDYQAALAASGPTWVAGALAKFELK